MLLTGKKSDRGRTDVPQLEPSTYLTDGRRLLRVVKGFAEPAEDSYALIEDCRTLGVQAWTPDELWETGLEVVRPGRC